MIYAVINSENLVVNVVEWDSESAWQPPENHQVALLTEGGIGWTYIDGKFIEPEEVTP